MREQMSADKMYFVDSLNKFKFKFKMNLNLLRLSIKYILSALICSLITRLQKDRNQY